MGGSASVAERVELVEAWMASGLTQRAFGKQRGLSVSTLNRWALAVRRGERMTDRGAARAAAAEAPIGPIVFREVASAVPLVRGEAMVRITLRSGVEVGVPAGTDVGYVRALVIALGGTC